jgi:WD40 repeat protein
MRLFGDDPAMWRHHRGLSFEFATSVEGDFVARAVDRRDVELLHPAQLPRPVLLQGHQGRLRSLAVHPNGRLVATTATDHNVRIWRSVGESEPLISNASSMAMRGCQ